MASSELAYTAPAWTITGQAERTVVSPTGQVANVVSVSFVLDNGTVGTVNVPAVGYSVDNVRALVAAKAQVLRDISNLTA